jgi:hypothetical protein
MNCGREWKPVRTSRSSIRATPKLGAESKEKIPEAIRVTDNLSDIPKNKPVVAYCT